MYIPPANRLEDAAKIRAFIHGHGFATLITQADGALLASHLPLLLDESPDGDRLRGHMARANRQWQSFAPEQELLCVFHGPHAYISPSWYEAKLAVPTWNYATIHVYGVPRVETDDGFVRKVLKDAIAKYESKRDVPWTMELPEDYMKSMMKAIVAFSVRITRIEAKYKLSQDRSAADRAGVMRGLEASDDPESRMLAQFVSEQEKTRPDPSPAP